MVRGRSDLPFASNQALFFRQTNPLLYSESFISRLEIVSLTAVTLGEPNRHGCTCRAPHWARDAVSGMRNGADNEAPARRASPSNQLVNAANTRADVMHELHAELRSGQITLPQAFRELGLGFDPKVSEEAAAFAVDSIDAFADLFNACVDMQETRAARASSPKNSRASPSMPGTLNAEGARLVTMYAGAEPDSIDHAAFSGVPGAAAELEVGALSLMRPASGLSGRDESPSMRDPKRERRRSREIDGLELSTELSPGGLPCRTLPAGSAAARAPGIGLEGALVRGLGYGPWLGALVRGLG
jgi:hypothetical protein